jgi:hypothetical protein
MVDKQPLHQTTNTSSWVDELYSKKLARQSIKFLHRESGEENPVLNLNTLKASRLYLREEMIRGPGVKQSLRAYFVAMLPSGNTCELSVLHCDYDPRNGRVRRNRLPVVRVAFSEHAFERLFERLRTNALGDVYRLALRPLSGLPLPEKEHYSREGMALHLAGFGIFPVKVIGAIDLKGKGAPCWGCVTYINCEPRQNDDVVHVVGPEQ